MHQNDEPRQTEVELGVWLSFEALIDFGERRALGGVPKEQTMLKGHLPRVIDHQAYSHTKIRAYFCTAFTEGFTEGNNGVHVGFAPE